MSIAVDLAALREQATASGPAVVLVSVRDGDRPHVVSAVVRWIDAGLAVAAGTGTRANVAQAPTVTLLWPAAGQDYSLIVDGTARVHGEDVVIEPTRAVLHRSVLAEGASGHHAGDEPRCIPVGEVS